MACFDNIIEYRDGCNSPTGLLLDNIVPYSEVEKYVTGDYDDASALIDEKITFAIGNVVQEVAGHFNSSYIPKSILSNKRIGFINETQTEIAAAAEYRGIELDICDKNTYYTLYVSSFDTYWNYTGNVSVLIIDTMTGETLDTVTVASVAGEVVTTYVDNSYNGEKRSRRIGFVYDATLVANYKTNLIGDGCITCTKGLYNMGGYVKGRAITYSLADTPILTNIDGASDTAGLSINYNLECDNESWICAHRKALRYPILYKVGEQIMEFALYNSDRFNTKTAINKAEIKERLATYHQDYLDQMSLVLKNIVPPNDGMCFVCNRTKKYVTTLP